MSSLQESHLELEFGRFRAAADSAFAPAPPLLLLIDCETRRFTIEHPSTAESFQEWCSEVEHAVAVGRHIVCVPIRSKSAVEIESLAETLGYAHWPSRTILSPYHCNERKPTYAAADLDQTNDQQRLRLLATLGRANF